MRYRYRQLRLALKLYRLGFRDWAGDALLDGITGGMTPWFGEPA